MQVRLHDLKPNPFRDFAVDPIDKEQVAALTKSIKANDFWGGVVCRQTSDGVEVAAGWHRVQAAIAAEKVTADLFVAGKGKMTDHDMIRIYATENATHRGEHGSAVAGSVASAIKFIARAVLTENWSTFVDQFSTAQRGAVRRNLLDNGVGEKFILQFLNDIPGITQRTIRDQIANLKASGIYDRLIGEVQAELAAIEKAERKAAAEAEAERKAAEAAAAKAAAGRKAADEQREREREKERLAKEKREKEIAAEKEAAKKQALKDKAKREAEAAAKAEERRKEAEAKEKETAKLAEKRRQEAEANAKEREAAAAKAKAEKEAADKAKKAAAEQERKLREERKAFDFEGVTAILKEANYVNLFRELVTAQGISPYVARNEQAALAQRLWDGATQTKDSSGHRHDHPTRFPTWMRDQTLMLAVAMQKEKNRVNKKEEEEAQKRDAYRKAEKKLEQFVRFVHSAKSTLWQLLDLAKQGGMNPVQHTDFQEAIESLVEVLEECRKAGFSKWAAEDEVIRAVNVKIDGRHHKLIAHLGNANEGERHNAADALHKAARAKGMSVAEMLGLE